MDDKSGALFKNEDECFRIAGQILDHYERVLGKGCSLELMQFSENRIYRVKDAAGNDRAVLRLCRPFYHTADELRAEIRWLSKIHRDPVSQSLTVPVPIADDCGRDLSVWPGGGGNQYYGVMFGYLSGTLLEDMPLDQQRSWFGRIGEAAAILHRQVRGWPGADDLRRFHWTYETMAGEHAEWGDWRRTPSLTARMRDVLAAADGLIRRNLEGYGMSRKKYGLIHGDLRPSNLLTEKDRLKIIDFDDCGYGWYIQDLAASLSFMETQDIVPQLAAEWLAGYETVTKLEPEDKRMIPTFIMMRRLQLLAWVTSRGDFDAAASRIPQDDFAAGTAELAERYVNGGLGGM